MAKDPAQRPASALQFGQLLVEVERQLGQPATSLPIEAIGAVDADMTAVAPATGDHSAGPLSPPEVSSPHTADRQPPEPSPWPPADDLAAPGLTGVVSNTPATSGEIEQADEWVRARPPDEGTNRPPWLGTALAASAAGLVVAALALWLIFVQGGGDDQGGEAGPTVADVSTTAQIDETSGTTEAVEDDAPPGFVQIRDESDSIRFVVPTAWTDVENGPGLDGLPYLGASPDFLGGFRESFTHPGASVTIIDGIQDLDSVLDQFTDPGCTPGPERSPLDLPYPGLLEVLTDCGSTGATLAHLAFVDQDQDLSAFMVIQMFSREDLATVGSTISDSLVLRDDFRG
jgi:hypothetical protein